MQRAGTHVEHPLVRADIAVANIERLVVNKQPDELAVGDVDEGLAVLRIAVTRLGVGQRSLLVVAVEVGARQRVRLPLVEVAAQPEVSVGQREHRLRLRQDVRVEPGLTQHPGLDGEDVVRDHESSSLRSRTTTSAPCARNASAWPTRSTPMTIAKLPARPAATPASASSKTA